MSFERTSSTTAVSTSDESRFLVGSERPLRKAEADLLLSLIKLLPDRQDLQDQLNTSRVYEMNDGGMGSLRFVASKADRRGSQALEARSLDADGTALEITLNLDQDGQLFELDIWKVDFSPLLHYLNLKRCNVSKSAIDLRSDTVTKPTPEMRAAMASAEVGDDVYGEDPTINRLEARAAEIFGKEAALFVPTGSMGNQIALRLHTQQGQEVVCESRAHVMDWEMGMAAVFSGCQLRTVAGQRGVLHWRDIEPALATTGLYYKAQTGLIWIENTHNMAGGTVTSLPVMQELAAGAHDRGLPIHLDGARVFNAAAALGTDVATLTRGFDTVNFCLSKGLCAPVGSLLVGSSDHIRRARPLRKALGGGMRQAGILAAAGLIALEQMPARLHEDHSTAKLLAEALSRIDGLGIDPDTVETNIVIFTTAMDAAELVTGMRCEGVLGSAIGPHSVRLVTHHDVNAAACARAAETIAGVAAGMLEHA